uniref:Uncharacterized protein n=1 Tax=Cacopsylla melanoneura TaxID=428564 RepID=A0A8D8WZG6_9HEMI
MLSTHASQHRNTYNTNYTHTNTFHKTQNFKMNLCLKFNNQHFLRRKMGCELVYNTYKNTKVQKGTLLKSKRTENGAPGGKICYVKTLSCKCQTAIALIYRVVNFKENRNNRIIGTQS